VEVARAFQERAGAAESIDGAKQDIYRLREESLGQADLQ
jgi:hypothetical protein